MTEQSMLTLQVLQQRLDALMLRDIVNSAFARRLHGVKESKNPDAQQAIFQTRWRKKLNSCDAGRSPRAARPSITYPVKSACASQKKQDILEAIRDHQVVIVAGETEQVKPPSCRKFVWNWGRGIVRATYWTYSQPRRRTVANRIAEELQNGARRPHRLQVPFQRSCQ